MTPEERAKKIVELKLAFDAKADELIKKNPIAGDVLVNAKTSWSPEKDVNKYTPFEKDIFLNLTTDQQDDINSLSNLGSNAVPAAPAAPAAPATSTKKLKASTSSDPKNDLKLDDVGPIDATSIGGKIMKALMQGWWSFSPLKAALFYNPLGATMALTSGVAAVPTGVVMGVGGLVLKGAGKVVGITGATGAAKVLNDAADSGLNSVVPCMKFASENIPLGALAVAQSVIRAVLEPIAGYMSNDGIRGVDGQVRLSDKYPIMNLLLSSLKFRGYAGRVQQELITALKDSDLHQRSLAAGRLKEGSGNTPATGTVQSNNTPANKHKATKGATNKSLGSNRFMSALKSIIGRNTKNVQVDTESSSDGPTVTLEEVGKDPEIKLTGVNTGRSTSGSESAGTDDDEVELGPLPTLSPSGTLNAVKQPASVSRPEFRRSSVGDTTALTSAIRPASTSSVSDLTSTSANPAIGLQVATTARVITNATIEARLGLMAKLYTKMPNMPTLPLRLQSVANIRPRFTVLRRMHAAKAPLTIGEEQVPPVVVSPSGTLRAKQ